MKIVILAAGKGTRLGGGLEPKPLTPLCNGKSILQLQIDTLTKTFSLDDIVLVVGYQKEMIMDLFPEVLFVYNDHYSVENTSKSLLRAISKFNEDILWLNGDVVFHPSALEAIIASKTSAMLVNRGAVGEEEVKYRTNGKGRILEVSKETVSPEGEALGINLFKKKDLPVLREGLIECKAMDYFEKGIEYVIEHGGEVVAAVVGTDQCVEIDFPEDVQRANSMIQSWKS